MESVEDDAPFMSDLARLELVAHLRRDIDLWDGDDADWVLNTLLSAAWPTRSSQDH